MSATGPTASTPTASTPTASTRSGTTGADPTTGDTRVSPGAWVRPERDGLLLTWRSTWDSWRDRARRLRGPATIHEQTGRERRLWIAVDAVAICVLLAIATGAFWLTYQIGWLWVAAMGGAVIGVMVGAIAAVKRWAAWLVAVLLTAAYLLFGSALAMPSQALAGVVPTPVTLRAIVLGAVSAWKQSLTIDAPIGEVGALLVVPLITMMIAGAAAISIALRSGRPGLAWLPPAGALLVGIGFGLQTSFLPVLLGGGFVLAALLWNSYRRDYQRQTVLGKRRRYSLRLVGSAMAVLALGAGAAAAAAPALAPTAPRTVLRDAVVPPLDIRSWPSPLQSFRSNLADHRRDTMFVVEGLPEGTSVRLATLDSYDGITFNVSNAAVGAPDGGTFRRVGTQIPDRTAGLTVTAFVSVGAYDGRWVPTLGQTRRLEFTGERRLELSEQFFYNAATGTGLDVGGLRTGDGYALEAVIPDQPARERVGEAESAGLDLPPAEPIADELKERARQWTAGAQTDGEAAIRLETELRRGYYSNGLADDFTSLSGHSSYRMTRLMNDHEGQMVGDEEQYAVAMALMARELGMPSRVVYGFRPSEATGESVAITGNDVTAWVEIAFDGLGWVEFQPAPDKTRSPQIDTNPAESKPRPQVENPPPPPERPENVPPDNTPPREGEEDQEPPLPIDWAFLRWIALAVGIPLLILGAPVATVLGYKARRRRLRMTRGTPLERITGGWDEVLDRSRDLGARPRAGLTRTENAAVLTERFPDAAAGLQSPETLARDADRASFAPDGPAEPQVEPYWHGVGAVGGTMAGSVGWWRRIRAALSLTSLRKLR